MTESTVNTIPAEETGVDRDVTETCYPEKGWQEELGYVTALKLVRRAYEHAVRRPDKRFSVFLTEDGKEAVLTEEGILRKNTVPRITGYTLVYTTTFEQLLAEARTEPEEIKKLMTAALKPDKADEDLKKEVEAILNDDNAIDEEEDKARETLETIFLQARKEAV